MVDSVKTALVTVNPGDELLHVTRGYVLVRGPGKVSSQSTVIRLPVPFIEVPYRDFSGWGTKRD